MLFNLVSILSYLERINEFEIKVIFLISLLL